MNNHGFHTIGIESSLDWQRIRKLLRIGLVASVTHLAADMLLGWGRQDESLSGMMRMFSAYGQLGNGAIYAAAMIGMLSILLEGLSYFGIYRLIVVKSQKYAPYPAWCWIFSVPVGMLAAKAVNVCGNLPIVNAIDCAWISIGNIWMFLGLLLSMKQAADGM